MSQTKIMYDKLNVLIKKANAQFTADDILNEARRTSNTFSHKKFIEMLEIITKNQTEGEQHLAEAKKQLEHKEPLYSLMKLLDNYDFAQTEEACKEDDSLEDKIMCQMMTTEEQQEIRNRLMKAAEPILNLGVSGTLSKSDTAAAALPSVKLKKKDTNVDEACDKLAAIHFDFDAALEYFTSNGAAVGICTHTFWNSGDDKEAVGIITPIGDKPSPVQEQMLLKDLLDVLVHMHGCYIEPKDELEHVAETTTDYYAHYNVEFKISEDVSIYLAKMAMLILPTAGHHNCIKKFIAMVQEPNAGQILQAFGSNLRNYLYDFGALMLKLDDILRAGNLTFQRLFALLQPVAKSMSEIANTLAEIMMKQLRGAPVLTLLHRKTTNLMSTDLRNQELFITFAETAAVPYTAKLELWLQKGIIFDETHELFIMENAAIAANVEGDVFNYWTNCYKIIEKRIPSFLEQVADIILHTGKYLNVIHRCGKSIDGGTPMKLQLTPRNNEHINLIKTAHIFASITLLEFLIKENDLMAHINSMKRYLLLNQGDFILQFLEESKEYLCKESLAYIVPMRLKTLLELSINTTTACADTHKEQLNFEFITNDIAKQFDIIKNKLQNTASEVKLNQNALECFAFTYKAKFPISLVLNRFVIMKYQNLFRQLFFCKHVERQLWLTWLESMKLKNDMAALNSHALPLCQKMLCIIQWLEYYMMLQIIEPNWKIFIKDAKKVKNIDELLQLHDNFIDICLKYCMQCSDKFLLYSQIFKICKKCLKLCAFMQPAALSKLSQESFAVDLKFIDVEFNNLMIALLKQIDDFLTETYVGVIVQDTKAERDCAIELKNLGIILRAYVKIK